MVRQFIYGSCSSSHETKIQSNDDEQPHGHLPIKLPPPPLSAAPGGAFATGPNHCQPAPANNQKIRIQICQNQALASSHASTVQVDFSKLTTNSVKDQQPQDFESKFSGTQPLSAQVPPQMPAKANGSAASVFAPVLPQSNTIKLVINGAARQGEHIDDDDDDLQNSDDIDENGESSLEDEPANTSLVYADEPQSGMTQKSFESKLTLQEPIQNVTIQKMQQTAPIMDPSTSKVAGSEWAKKSAKIQENFKQPMPQPKPVHPLGSKQVPVQPPRPSSQAEVQAAMQRTIVLAACRAGLAFNQSTLKSRRDLKLFYKEQRSTVQRLDQHGTEPKSNFLHCGYTPGTAFINTMNNQNQQRGQAGQFQLGRGGKAGVDQSFSARMVGAGIRAGSNPQLQGQMNQRVPLQMSSIEELEISNRQKPQRKIVVNGVVNQIEHFGNLNMSEANNRQSDEYMGSHPGLNNSDTAGFRCITCNRGPPYTKKYAKNQCQTCYKKDKKFQRIGPYPMHGGYQPWSHHSSQYGHADM